MWRKGTFVHCWWECKLIQRLWGTVWRFLKKLKIELPHDPVIPLLGIYPKEKKTQTQKDICTPMFTAALSTIAKTTEEASESTDRNYSVPFLTHHATVILRIDLIITRKFLVNSFEQLSSPMLLNSTPHYRDFTVILTAVSAAPRTAPDKKQALHKHLLNESCG